MDSFELNKIIGALLAVVFVIFSVNLISHAVFSSPAPETPGYAIEVPEDEGTGEGDAEEEPESILPLMASADPSAGEGVFKRCQACHSVEEGGPNKVGPNLWNVVDSPVASDESFSYSSAMVDFSEGGDVTWTYENLDHFLADPRGYIPGTAMGFAGLSDVEDRANVIAYMRSMSDNPAPLPEAGAQEGDDADSAPADEDGTAASGEGDTAASEESAEAARDGASADDDAAEATGDDAAEAAGDDVADAGNGDGQADAGDAATPADGAGEEPESILPLMASADASAGEGVFTRCQACHSVEEGGPNKVGPNLWNVVDAPVASDESFSYSSAMVDFSEGGDVTWTYENLDHFLADPLGYIPGTAMGFAGLSDIEDRANVIAFLRSMSDDPAPLPEAGAQEGGDDDGAPAGEDGTATSEEGAEAARDGASADGDATEAAGDDAANDAGDAATSPDGAEDGAGGDDEEATGEETADEEPTVGEQ